MEARAELACSSIAGLFKIDLSDIANVDVIRGPIKRPSRAIAKAYRSYASNVARLTDIVRCTVLCKDPLDLIRIAEKIRSRGCPAKNTRRLALLSKMIRALFNWCSSRVDSTAEDHSEEAEDTLIEKDEKNTRLCDCKNRFDDEWTADNDLAAEHRDLSFKFLMAFEESDCGGCCFVPVSN
jgi:hypothetical protein